MGGTASNDRTARGLLRGRMRRGGTVAAIAALVVIGASCVPVVHPVYTEVEVGDSVRFLDLSDDGHYAFVWASTTGNTVPGQGWWRVDRRDGTAVEVPQIIRVSQDGRRVLSSGVIWDDGVVTPRPTPGPLFSKDLRWGIWWDSATGRYQRWSLATGTLTPIDVGYPLAPGTAHLSPDSGDGVGIADDGNIAWFRLSTPAGCTTRFVVIDQGLTFDHLACDLVVAASGGAFVARSALTSGFDPGYQRLELRRIFDPSNPVAVLDRTGTVRAFDNVTIADGGSTLWAVEIEFGEGPVGADRVAVVAASESGTVELPITSEQARGHLDATPNGRWLVFRSGCTPVIFCTPEGPYLVFDRVTRTVEELHGANGDGALAISADASVVAHAGPPTPTAGPTTGWYEHTVAVSP